MLAHLTRLSTAFAIAGLAACSSSPVPVGANSQDIGATDGSSSGSGATSPCADIPVPQLACASGPTVENCDTSTTPPKWDMSCPSETNQGSSGSSSSPCGSIAIPTIGCLDGQPLFVCDAAGSSPHWSITCPNNDASSTTSSGNTGSSSTGQSGDASSSSNDGFDLCADKAVPTLGCATGQPILTCIVDAGTPHWNVTCP